MQPLIWDQSFSSFLILVFIFARIDPDTGSLDLLASLSILSDSPIPEDVWNYPYQVRDLSSGLVLQIKGLITILNLWAVSIALLRLLKEYYFSIPYNKLQ